MRTSPKPRKETASSDPEYTWADASAAPQVVWEYAARPLWVQAVPDADGVLLMEKTRLSFRGAATGDARWDQPSVALPDELAADRSGILFATGQDARELDPASGAERWRSRMGNRISALALEPGRAYIATERHLFAVDRASGRIQWRAPCGEEPVLHVHAEAGLLVVDNPHTESVQAYATEGGARLWEYKVEDQPVVAGPLIKGVAVISAHGSGVAGVDAHTGEPRWNVTSEGTFESQAVALGERAFFTDGTAYGVEAATGKLQWKRPPADENDKIFSLRTEGSELFAETWRGLLLALEPETGAVRWERNVGQVHGMAADAARLYLRVSIEQDAPGKEGAENRWAAQSLDRPSGKTLWELHARRTVQDLTRVENTLIVELRNQVLALRI